MTSTKDEVSMNHGLTVPLGYSSKVESTEEMLSVHEVCRAAGISRKTLYHYDRIGLIRPYSHTGKQNGRMYRQDVLNKLQEIRAYKNAGLTLKEIDSILNDPETDRKEVLLQAYSRLKERMTITGNQLKQLKDIMQK